MRWFCELLGVFDENIRYLVERFLEDSPLKLGSRFCNEGVSELCLLRFKGPLLFVLCWFFSFYLNSNPVGWDGFKHLKDGCLDFDADYLCVFLICFVVLVMSKCYGVLVKYFLSDRSERVELHLEYRVS